MAWIQSSWRSSNTAVRNAGEKGGGGGGGGGGGEDRRLSTIIYTIYCLQELNWNLPEGVAWTVCVKRKALAQNLRNFWKTIQWEWRLLKRPLCHTIRYLFKKRKSVCASSEQKKNGPVLLCKTILRYRNCFMLSFATDGKDGHGLKLDEGICLIY